MNEPLVETHEPSTKRRRQYVLASMGLVALIVLLGCKSPGQDLHTSLSRRLSGQDDKTVYQFTPLDINEQPKPLKDFEGKVMIITNVATNWGATKVNYAEFEQLYLKHKADGLAILGFPCNQFLGQEPGTDEQIKEAAKDKKSKTYATWPLFHKINVNGGDEIPLFKFLKEQLPVSRWFTGNDIKWNFEKFLIDRTGKAVKRYDPGVKPLEMEKDIIELLHASKRVIV